MKDIALTSFTRFSGCGAKLGPEMLDKALCGLSQPSYPDLIADYRTSEDCGIFALNETQALIQTIDFFPPIVDDPFLFGRIAAANALSDIYAMGGKPLTAVSVVCFPKDQLDIAYLREMTAGGLDALIEAEAALVGGHSIDDLEPKFGYSVTGIVDRDRLFLNNTVRPGDAIILTKPLGTGVINTALRASMASELSIDAAERSMSALNKTAAEILSRFDVSACTDVTGFGLIGHLCEMIQSSAYGAALSISSIPLLPDVREYISTGLIPEGTYRNKDFRSGFIDAPDSLDPDDMDILFDPQTSGGLLFTVREADTKKLLEMMHSSGIAAAQIGLVNEHAERITIDA